MPSFLILFIHKFRFKQTRCLEYWSLEFYYYLLISVRVSKAFPTHISQPEYFKDRFDFITQNYKPTMKPKPNRKVSLINNFFFHNT